MSDTASQFDRALALVDMPDTIATKPTTVTAINPLLGHGGTHIVQSARNAEGEWTVFVQVIDIGGGNATQLVLPNKVAEAIYRQRDAIIKRSRRKPKPKLTAEQRKEKRLREARAVLREHKKSKQQES